MRSDNGHSSEFPILPFNVVGERGGGWGGGSGWRVGRRVGGFFTTHPDIAASSHML